jgi:hypothetical protein
MQAKSVCANNSAAHFIAMCTCFGRAGASVKVTGCKMTHGKEGESKKEGEGREGRRGDERRALRGCVNGGETQTRCCNYKERLSSLISVTLIKLSPLPPSSFSLIKIYWKILPEVFGV